MKYLALFCIALLNFANPVTAQRHERNRFPKAILVQLSSERNRMASLQKVNANRELEQLKKDAVAVAKRMRLDFRDNFKIYPVYFFVDTNLDKVRHGNFAGVLLDANGNVVAQPGLADNSFDFFIVYYGYPVIVGKQRTKHIAKETDDAKSFDAGHGRRLIVCNYEMEQLTYVHLPQPRIINIVPPAERKYYYNSPKFDIGYHALAKKLPGIIAGLPLNYQ